MATCDVQTLLDDANCFATLAPGQRDLLILQLLCDVRESSIGGASTISTSQVTATDSRDLLVAADTTRKSVTFKNTDTADSVWIGDVTVTTGNGFELAAGEVITLHTTAAIYGITSGGTTAVVGIIEET